MQLHPSQLSFLLAYTPPKRCVIQHHCSRLVFNGLMGEDSANEGTSQGYPRWPCWMLSSCSET